MGCDIHAYIEYADTKTAEGRTWWKSFGGRTNPGRNYAVFGYLAGVRGGGTPIAEPRGRVEDGGWCSTNDDRLYISATDASEESTTPEHAASWVKNGSSQYILDRDGKPTWVTHPDHHSHSWLTADEWEAALRHSDGEWSAGPEYYAMLAAMREFERRGCSARVVFWFDN